MRLCRRGLRKRLALFVIATFFTSLFLLVLWRHNGDTSQNIVDVVPGYTTDLCGILGEKLLAVILVNSEAKNAKKRLLIRSTWANKFLCRALGINVVFLISNSTDLHVEAEVSREGADYGDILHFTLFESYYKMSEKVIGGLRWTLEQCPKALYIIKADDDMFINVFQLSVYLNSLKAQNVSREFLCLVWKGLPVQRNIGLKWYVSVEEYPHPTYPTCCSGSTYIMPVMVAKTIAELSRTIPSFRIDDVYLTGILAEEGSLGHRQIGNFFGFVDYRYIDIIEGRIIFAHVTRNGTIIKNWLWNEVVGFQKRINNSLLVVPETYIVKHITTSKLYTEDYGDTG